MTNWQNKSKIEQSGDNQEIQTPDGQQILVGALEDQVLVYYAPFNNWNLKTKANQPDWQNKSKIEQSGWNLKTKVEQ